MCEPLVLFYFYFTFILVLLQLCGALKGHLPFLQIRAFRDNSLTNVQSTSCRSSRSVVRLSSESSRHSWTADLPRAVNKPHNPWCDPLWSPWWFFRWYLQHISGFAIKRSRVRVSAGNYGVKTLGKFFTPMCLCHQAVQFGTGESWGVNRHAARYTNPVSVALQRGWCLAEGYRNGDQRRLMGPCGSGRTLLFKCLARPQLAGNSIISSVISCQYFLPSPPLPFQLQRITVFLRSTNFTACDRGMSVNNLPRVVTQQ